MELSSEQRSELGKVRERQWLGVWARQELGRAEPSRWGLVERSVMDINACLPQWWVSLSWGPPASPQVLAWTWSCVGGSPANRYYLITYRPRVSLRILKKNVLLKKKRHGFLLFAFGLPYEIIGKCVLFNDQCLQQNFRFSLCWI